MHGDAIIAGGDNSSTAFDGVITGTGGLIKEGTGTMTLNGTDAAAGTTYVDGGTLVVDGNFAAASSVVVQNASSVLQLGSPVALGYNAVSVDDNDGLSLGSLTNATLGSLDGSGDIDIFGAALTVGGNNAGMTYSGALTSLGTGIFTKTGDGTLNMSGTSLFAGVLTVAGGEVAFSNSVTLGGLAGIGIVAIGANPLTVGDGNISSSFAGHVEGSASVTKTGTGTLKLSGTNLYTGGTTITAGTLALGDFATNHGTTGSGNIIDDGTLLYEVSTTDVVSQSNNISGTGALVQLGPNRLVVSGSNTYTGGTTVSGGILQFNSPGAIGGSTPNVTVESGGTVAADYAIDQSILGRIASGSTGVVALVVDSSNSLDFSTAGAGLANVRLGAYPRLPTPACSHPTPPRTCWAVAAAR